MFIDVGGDNSNLIHVSGQHDLFPTGFDLSFGGDQVSERIDVQLICQGFNFRSDEITDSAFISRWTSGFNKFLDQGFHRYSGMVVLMRGEVFPRWILAWVGKQAGGHMRQCSVQQGQRISPI